MWGYVTDMSQCRDVGVWSMGYNILRLMFKNVWYIWRPCSGSPRVRDWPLEVPAFVKKSIRGWLTACEKIKVFRLFSTGHNCIRYRDRTLLIFCWRFTHETLVTVMDIWKRIGVMLCENRHKPILPEDLQLLRKTYRSSGRLITATEEL